jgi:hypothetical protein
MCNKSNIISAIETIDETIGGIKKICFNWKENTFNIWDNNLIKYSVFPKQCAKKRHKNKLILLACAAYRFAQKDNPKPGNIFVDKNASTTHHKEGLNPFFYNVDAQWNSYST